jgi:hypothetical protein
MKNYLLLIAAVIFLFSCKAGPAGPIGATGADASEPLHVAMFQDGLYPSGAYAGCHDARIWAGANADFNYGAYTYMQLGSDGTDEKRGLVRFDITELPPGAAVQKAIITLYCSGVPFGAPEFAFYEIDARDWGEAEVTWNDYSSGNAWTTAGGDITAAAGGFVKPGSSSYVSWEINPAVIQAWYDDGPQNFGLVLKAKNPDAAGECVFSSSEAAEANKRPKLAVYYKLQ